MRLLMTNTPKLPQAVDGGPRRHRRGMSLLREAEKCLGNFRKYNKSLNAFINGVRDDRLLLDRVKESDIRRESGMFFSAGLANNALTL